MIANVLLLAGLAYPQDTSVPELAVGVPATGRVTDQSFEIDDAVIAGRQLWLPLRAVRFRFRPPETGTYRVGVDAELSTTFAVVRDASGHPLAWEATTLEITVDIALERGAEYLIDAATVFGVPDQVRVVIERDPASGATDPGAIERARAMLARLEDHYGADHPQVACVLDHLGFLHFQRSDYRGALPYMERALQIWKSAFGDEHPVTAYGDSQLAHQLSRLGQYDSAIATWEECIGIRRRLLGDEHRDTLSAQNELAVVLVELGRLDEAARIFRHLLDVAAESGTTSLGPTDLYMWRSNLAFALNGQGKQSAAREFAALALAEAERVVGPEDVRITHQLNTLATIESGLGHFAHAEALLRRALEIRRRKLPAGHTETATSINNLAVLLADSGRLEDAEPLFRECLGSYRRALGEHWWVGAVQANLGDLLVQRGRVEEGVRHLRAAIALFERLGYGRHPNSAITIRMLGTAAFAMQDWEEAEERFREAAAIQEGALGPRHPEALKSRMYLGLLLRVRGRLDEAQPLYEQTLADLRAVHGPQHHDFTRMLEGLGIIQHVVGNRDTALASFLGVIEGRWRHLGGELVASSSEGRFRQAAMLQTTLDILLSAVREDPGSDAADAAFAWQAAVKGIVFRHALRQRELLREQMSERAKSLLDELEMTRAQLSRLAYATDVPDAAAHAARIAELHQHKNELEQGLGESLGTRPTDEQLRVAALARRLPERSALIDFRFFRRYEFGDVVDGAVVTPEGPAEPRLAAWVVRHGEPHAHMIDLGEADPVASAVENYVRQLVAHRSRPRRGTQDRPPNDVLRELLWAPLSAALSDVDLVFVSADGELAKVPLGTIQTADGRFLIEDRAFVCVQDPISLDRLLQRDPPRRSGDSSLLALGGVDYEEDAGAPTTQPLGVDVADASALRDGFGDYWRPLPETLGEVRALTRLHERRFADGARLALTGSDATKARLLTAAPHHDVLHLATHGFFEPAGLPSIWEQALAEAHAATGGASPSRRLALTGYPPGLLAGIVLAGANREEDRDRAILTAEETAGLDLAGCDLVVLSACETALGEMRGGEGMLSLRRAFHESGARTVVSSLWSVRDDSTARLMRAFYANLWERGLSPLDALRTAQLAMLELNRRRHDGDGMPSTWGAFVLSGEWR